MLNLPGNTVPPFGWPQKHCLQSANSGAYDAHLSLVNNTRTFESLVPFDGGGDATLGYVNPVGADPLQVVLTGAAELALRHPVAYPGGELSVTVPSGDRGAIRMTPNIPLTALWTVLDQSPVKDLLDSLGGSVPAASQVLKDDLGCVLSMLGAKESMDSGAWNTVDGLTGMLKSCIDFRGHPSADPGRRARRKAVR
jgi:hypothetical protein